MKLHTLCSVIAATVCLSAGMGEAASGGPCQIAPFSFAEITTAAEEVPNSTGRTLIETEASGVMTLDCPVGSPLSPQGLLDLEVIFHLTAPLGSTKGSLKGDVVLQFTPPIGSNKGSLKGRTGVEPIPSLSTATESFSGLIEGSAECDDTGICVTEMILSATSYEHNQTDLEFLFTGEFDLIAHEWLSLSVIDSFASDGKGEALYGSRIIGLSLLLSIEQNN